MTTQTKGNDMSTHTELTIGSRVALAQDIDRFPHFIANKGEMGKVVDVTDDFVSVKMDNHISGAEEWDNEVMVGSMYEEELRDVLVVL
jgi:hypothetical protein